jgi:hypothetical protein
MKWPEVDQYIQDFERVARKAEYPLTAPATVRYFLKGLTKSIVNDIVKPPKVNTYAEIKQRAIDSVASQLLIYEMFKQDKGTTNRPPSSRWNRFAQPNPTNQQTSRPNIRGYNSTNAPRHLNNAPVPMDVDADRARANRNNNWRNRNPQGRTVQMQDEQGNVYQVNVAQTQPTETPATLTEPPAAPATNATKSDTSRATAPTERRNRAWPRHNWSTGCQTPRPLTRTQ